MCPAQLLAKPRCYWPARQSVALLNSNPTLIDLPLSCAAACEAAGGRSGLAAAPVLAAHLRRRGDLGLRRLAVVAARVRPKALILIAS